MAAEFSSIETLRKALQTLSAEDASASDAARSRNAELTKPPGALGRLEDLAIWYCGWRGDPKAQVNNPQVIVFAGNHGVASQGVSAFPIDVTAQMVANFRAGGAAVNQLASAVGANFSIIPIELDRPTNDFCTGPAQSQEEFLSAFNIGFASVDSDADLLVVGEMGIGNTTSAAAIALSLFGGHAKDWTGTGTGVSGTALDRKTEVVSCGVAAHANCYEQGLETLRCLGGREISAMAGAILRARQLRIPVILDGFICTAAAACLHAENSEALTHTVAGHLSAEGAHGQLLERLGKPPLLALNMRLGEASGGTLAISILKGALACHSGMSTFAEAGVSDS